MFNKLKEKLAGLFAPRLPEEPVSYPEYLWEVRHAEYLGTLHVRAACADVVSTGVWFRNKDLLGVLFVPSAELRYFVRCDCVEQEPEKG